MRKILKLLRTLIEFLGRLTGILNLLEHLRRRPETGDAAAKDESAGEESANDELL